MIQLKGAKTLQERLGEGKKNQKGLNLDADENRFIR